MKEIEARNYNRRYAKEYGFWRSLWYLFFIITVVNPISWLQYKLKFEGRENIEKDKKYLFAANHVSYLDPPFMAAAVFKKIAYMAKQELFTDKNWLLRNLVITLGAFAVNREKPELATFKTIFDLTKTNWSLGIFPEGKICKTNSIEHIHKGFTMIAKKAKMDIVPVGICNFNGYAKKVFDKDMTVKIGKPISYQLDSDEIIRQWAEQICELTGYENKLVIDAD